ncbi:MAG: hypothetical protein AAGA20_23110 [Planctomycetota bacterium]
MIRLSTLTLTAFLSAPFIVSCASAPPPFSPSQEAYRGVKARTFAGTPEEVRPAVLATLRNMGFDVHVDSLDTSYITANRGMAAKDPTIPGEMRTWTRAGVEIRFIDRHRRAPRTLVELDVENIQGSSEGAIEASFGSVPSSFYDEFFQSVESQVPQEVRPIGLVPPA